MVAGNGWTQQYLIYCDGQYLSIGSFASLLCSMPIFSGLLCSGDVLVFCGPGCKDFQTSIPLFYLSITQDIKIYCCRRSMSIDSVAGLLRLSVVDNGLTSSIYGCTAYECFGAIVAAMVCIIIKYAADHVYLVLENKLIFTIRTDIKKHVRVSYTLPVVLDIVSTVSVLSVVNVRMTSHRSYFGNSITITINDNSITIRYDKTIRSETPAKGPGDTPPQPLAAINNS